MKRFVIFFIPAAWLAWHFSVTVLYLLPVTPATKSYSETVSQYMEPIFSQNWGLFAPEPATSSLQLWYRCRPTDRGWGQWHDPLARLYQDHHRFPFTFRGKLSYIYQAMARELLNARVRLVNQNKCTDPNCFSQIMEELKGSSQYLLVSQFTKDLCRKHDSMTQAQFRIVKVFPKPYSQRNDPNARGAVETVEFQPVALKDENLQAMNFQGGGR